MSDMSNIDKYQLELEKLKLAIAKADKLISDAVKCMDRGYIGRGLDDCRDSLRILRDAIGK